MNSSTAELGASLPQGDRWQETRRVLMALLIAIGWFWLLKSAYMRTAATAPAWLAFVGFVWLAPLAAFWRLTYSGLAPAYSILVRGLALILGFYAAASYHSFPQAVPGVAGSLGGLLVALQILAVVSAVIAWRRPVFAAVPALYVLIAKDWTQYIFGVPGLTRTDYMPVVELALFMPMTLAVASLLERRARKAGTDALDIRRFTHVMFIVAVAIHFGNYFHSALEKLMLEGGPLRWLFENPTYILLANTLVSGNLPIGHLPRVTAVTYEVLRDHVVWLNFATLASQLYSVIAITSRRQLILTTLFYDLSHIAIFVVTGILFWKWILLNIVIVIAARTIRETDMGRLERVIGPILVVAAALVFFAARLGWYDSPAFNKSYFTVTDRAGREFEVPSNYFGAASVSIAQMRLGMLGEQVHPTVTWGTSGRLDLVRRMSGCRYSDTLGEPLRRADPELIATFVRRHHSSVLQQVDARGHLWYDLYPHHIWSNPALFSAFDALDKRDIVSYTYVTESMCVHYEAGRFVHDTVGHSSLVIRVDN